MMMYRLLIGEVSYGFFMIKNGEGGFFVCLSLQGDGHDTDEYVVGQGLQLYSYERYIGA